MEPESAIPPLPTLSLASQPSRVEPLRALGWLDVVGILAASLVLLLVSWLRSRHRIFWGDEIVGWTLLREPTFARLFHSWSNGADSSGLFFFVFLRPWLALFGATEVSARLFSTMGLCVALGLIWVAARRFFPIGIVSFCVPFAFVSSSALLAQLSNARTYGLFVAAVALVSLLFLVAEPGARLSAALLLATGLAHSLLIGSHVLGIVYSGFFVAGLVARDLRAGQLRPRLYASALAGWVTLLWVAHNLKANADIGKPYFWTERPHVYSFPLGLFAYATPALILGMLLALPLVLRRRRAPVATGETGRNRASLYALLGTLFTIALFLFLKSFVGNSVFIPRYVLPMLVFSALLLCDLLDRAFTAFAPTATRLRFLWPALAVLALAFFVRRLDPFERGGEDYTADLVAKVPPGIPAVITDVSLFGEVVHYQGDHARIETEIDWPFTLKATGGPRDVAGAHMLEIWQRLGYFPGKILPAATILQQPEFVVISRESFPLWFQERIASNPEFATVDLGRAGGDLHVLHLWLVRRRTGSTTP